MPAIVVTDGRIEPDPETGEPILHLDYKKPASHLIGDEGPHYGGHTHAITARNVWWRMAAYDIDKAEALEQVVLEHVVSPGEMDWPATPAQRKAARGKWVVASARRFADLLPDPLPRTLDAIREAQTGHARGLTHRVTG